MAFCSFDPSVAGFDVTPVENMFISEYMLRAPGNYVKVYLYGLMNCYHNQARMSLASMARDLELTEQEVEHAFRYWARNGLVRQMSDHPVTFAYMNIKQLTLTRAQDPGEKLYNRAFTEEVRRILGDRPMETPDYNKIYDWMEIYEFPEEVVLMLLRYEMKRSRGRFSFEIAEKTAKDWAQRGVRTPEDVDQLVLIDNERKAGLKKLLARLGQRREPSDDEKALYNKWMDEWGFDQDAILEACAETVKGAPTMAYLNGILLRQHQMGRHQAGEMRRGIMAERSERDFARDIYAALGRVGVTPSAEDMSILAGWQKDGFDQEMILMAAREAHGRSGGGSLEDIEAKLHKWQREGFTTVDQVSAARTRIKMLNEQLRELYAAAGLEKRVNQPDRDLMTRWMGEWGMDRALVMLAMGYAKGSGAPMLVADRILTAWHDAGIGDVQAAQAEHEAHLRGGSMRASAQGTAGATMQRHDYTQDDYRSMMIDLDEEVRR